MKLINMYKALKTLPSMKHALSKFSLFLPKPVPFIHSESAFPIIQKILGSLREGSLDYLSTILSSLLLCK